MLKRIFLVVAVAILAVGCASGNNPIPTTPDTSDLSGPDITNTAQSEASGRALWGYFDWIIDTEQGLFEAIPMRSTEMHLNVSKFVDGPPTRFTFSNFNVDQGASTISLDVGIEHPFPGKPNLAGFDVHGVVIGKGSVYGFDDPSIILAGNDDVHLVNADGWSRWWNPTEFNIANNIVSYRDGSFGIPHSVGDYNATINGFKLFADDLGNNEHPDGLNIADRAVFSPGSLNSRHYQIYFPQEENKFVIRFNYAIDVSWEPIPGYNPGDPVIIPDDYPASANQPEPFRIHVESNFNSLYFETSSIKGGSLVYEVSIFDWQGYLTDGDVADEIAEVKLECPEGMSQSFTGTLTDAGSGNQAYAVYEIEIDGDYLTNNGDYEALISVISANGDYQPGMTGYTGSAPLTSYLRFPFAEIEDTGPVPNEPPVADATADVNEILIGETVTFDASTSEDNDGMIMSYEWDFDGDGTFGDPWDAGDEINPQKFYDTAEFYNVDLQVTDDDDATDTLDAPILITVTGGNIPPIACATSDVTEIIPGESITFDATCSEDLDGIIVLYEWDFDGNDSYGDAWDSGTDTEPTVIYNDIGIYEVDLRVYDNESAVDLLDDKITIYVVDPFNEPPTACADLISTFLWEDQPIEFDGTCSDDTDGFIIEYQWDFDNDGIYGDEYDEGTDSNPVKMFGAGDQTVDLKIIDDGGKSDTLDTPIQFFVESHVTITLPEDQDFKSVNGYEYYAMSCVIPEDIPFDYLDYDGPWDFTGSSYLPDPDYLYIYQPSDQEIEDYESFFPSTVDYYTRNDLYGIGIAGYLYMAEEPDFVSDVLYIHGHIERLMHLPFGVAFAYNEDTGGPIGLQFPWDIYTDEQWELEILNGSSSFIKITYNETGIGEGDATIPFEGVWDTRVLLTRAYLEVFISEQLAAQVILYKWTADDGKQVGRLYAMNTSEDINFNMYTFEITGESRFTALKAEL